MQEELKSLRTRCSPFLACEVVLKGVLRRVRNVLRSYGSVGDGTHLVNASELVVEFRGREKRSGLVPCLPLESAFEQRNCALIGQDGGGKRQE